MRPGFFPYTAGVVWNNVGVISIGSLGWSDVSLERRHLDGVLFLSEVDECKSMNTQHEVEHQGWVRTYIHHTSFERSWSIVNFNLKA